MTTATFALSSSGTLWTVQAFLPAGTVVTVTMWGGGAGGTTGSFGAGNGGDYITGPYTITAADVANGVPYVQAQMVQGNVSIGKIGQDSTLGTAFLAAGGDAHTTSGALIPNPSTTFGPTGSTIWPGGTGTLFGGAGGGPGGGSGGTSSQPAHPPGGGGYSGSQAGAAGQITITYTTVSPITVSIAAHPRKPSAALRATVIGRGTNVQVRYYG